MSANMVAVLYLISALMFIFALRGLSHPESSRLGNIFGIVGMVIAIITTLMFKSVLSYVEIGAVLQFQRSSCSPQAISLRTDSGI